MIRHASRNLPGFGIYIGDNEKIEVLAKLSLPLQIAVIVVAQPLPRAPQRTTYTS
jgi:uncharacterized protein (UPF0371 family)